MNKIEFTKIYNYYDNDTLENLAINLANRLNNTKGSVKELTARVSKFYKEINPDTKAVTLFETYLQATLFRLKKEAKQVREEELTEIIKQMEEAEDRPTTLLLSEGEYATTKLNNYIREEKIDLTKERVLLIAPAGAGKSTATGGLELIGRQGLIILKDTKVLVENAVNDLRKEMKEGHITKRAVYTLHGEAKIESSKLKDILGTPGVIIVATYNKVGELMDMIESRRTSIEIARQQNKLIHQTTLVDWIFVLDETHKLLTDAGFRPDTLIEVQAKLEKRGGYLTMTATPKTYCPLEYDRIINVRKEIEDINSEVLIYNKAGTDLEVVFKEVIKPSDKSRRVFWFENDSKALELMAEELRKEGFKAEEMSREVFNNEKEDKESLAYSITQGKLNSEIVLTTKLLLEGVSFTEYYDEVHYFLKLSGEDIHSLEIIQAAARARKAGKIFIHIVRAERALKDGEVLDLKQFTTKRIEVEIDDEVKAADLGILLGINLKYKQIKENKIDVFKAKDIIENYKAGLFDGGAYLLERFDKTSDMKVRELYYSNLFESFKNYKRDVRLEATELGRNLFLKRLSKAGHKNVTIITEEFKLPDEEKKDRDTKRELSDRADREAIVEEFMKQDIESIREYLRVVGADKKESKLKRFIAWYVYYMLRLGEPLDKILETVRETKKSKLKTQMEKWKAALKYILVLIDGKNSKLNKMMMTRLGDNGRADMFLERLTNVEVFLKERGETIEGRDLKGFKITIEAKDWENDYPSLYLQNILVEFFTFEKKQWRSGDKKDERYYEITGYSDIIQKIYRQDTSKYEDILRMMEEVEKEIN